MMIHTGVVMVRCPATGRELSTGVEMDAATFERLPDIRSRIKCPVCYLDFQRAWKWMLQRLNGFPTFARG
jgi:hypothetical protein